MKLWRLEALERRVSPDCSVFGDIEESLRIVRIGDRGERSLDYYIELVSSNDLLVFYDLRLPRGEHHFQMDTVLVTPRFVLLVEVKNISGDIYFNKESKQMIRVLNNISETFPNPLLQVSQQKFQLQQFLQNYGFPNIPIYTLVVFASRNGILHIQSDDTFHLGKIISIQEFIFKYQKLNESVLGQVWSEGDLNRVSDLFIREHKPEDVDLMKRFGLKAADLMKGVHCPKCGRLGVQHKHGKWVCICGSSSKDAHVLALRDYALLIDEWIINQEARNFLGVESRHAIKRILSNFEKEGGTKGTRYNLKPLIY
ncbi:nuclease-related domain-containing protein [Piscibacillus halophilus]|uniref:nuclease-related domain-containing protein n=1 Tax=Piscibacillus halophilus TaxID=571933 RepID=UPI0015896270|nr:nuclease-related domain-containing protein [Piscibacillus halophilus]